MSWFNESWRPEINWHTSAGQVLDKLVNSLPASRPWRIIVFGSSPLQLAVDPTFLSADVVIIAQEDVESFCRAAGLLKGQADLYIEPCTVVAFTASADWMERACETQRKHVTFILPHPIDILVAKIKRLDEKDLRAFHLVRDKLGHPSEEELIKALRRVVDIYRPSFDEESGNNARENTELLWRNLFGKTINVAQEIIAPALAERRKNYGQQNQGFREALAHYGKS
ncbi:MAG TPA: hypothetical protein VK615_11980 [Candidatus Binatia bacterium]|nr:hypothetical protein [Candidatus Binatia bacterium]